jgi:hypothetical protein
VRCPRELGRGARAGVSAPPGPPSPRRAAPRSRLSMRRGCLRSVREAGAATRCGCRRAHRTLHSDRRDRRDRPDPGRAAFDAASGACRRRRSRHRRPPGTAAAAPARSLRSKPRRAAQWRPAAGDSRRSRPGSPQHQAVIDVSNAVLDCRLDQFGLAVDRIRHAAHRRARVRGGSTAL